jgi:CRP-like cAMP-binding protein
MQATDNTLLHFLQQNPILGSKAIEVAACFIEKEWAKNDLLLKEGQVSNEYIFLAQGAIRAFAHDVNGMEVTTGFCIEGQVAFEVSSFFNRTPSRENMQALTDCKGWYLTHEKLNTLFHTIPEFREFGRSVLVKGFAALKERTLSMITETAEERYIHLLQNNPAVFQYASLKQIASYLGMTDTSLSRIRKQFSQK